MPTIGALLTDRIGSGSASQAAREMGKTPQWVLDLMRNKIKEFAEPNTIPVLARFLNVSQTVVVLAYAKALGLNVSLRTGPIASLLPPEIELLDKRQLAVLRNLIDSYAHQNLAGEFTEADEEEVMAAYRPRMQSEGKARRRSKD